MDRTLGEWGRRKRTVMSRNRRKVECPEMDREIEKERTTPEIGVDEDKRN